MVNSDISAREKEMAHGCHCEMIGKRRDSKLSRRNFGVEGVKAPQWSENDVIVSNNA